MQFWKKCASVDREPTQSAESLEAETHENGVTTSSNAPLRCFWGRRMSDNLTCEDDSVG